MTEALKTLDSRLRGNDKDIIKQGKTIGHYFYMLQQLIKEVIPAKAGRSDSRYGSTMRVGADRPSHYCESRFDSFRLRSIRVNSDSHRESSGFNVSVISCLWIPRSSILRSSASGLRSHCHCGGVGTAEDGSRE